MLLLNSLKVISARTKDKLKSLEVKILQINNELFFLEDKINQYEDIIAAANVHLNSFFVDGRTSLKEILEIKARQATIKRKIAESELELGEYKLKRNQSKIALKSAHEENIFLNHKSERFEHKIYSIKKRSTQYLLNRYDNETEEQLNWRV